MDPTTSTNELLLDESPSVARSSPAPSSAAPTSAAQSSATQSSATQPSLHRTWGLGTMATVLCVLLGLSGLVLMFFYRPDPATASLSLLDLEAVSGLAFLRGVHLWGSWVLVAVVWLHLFRVVVREAYRPPNHKRWLEGLVLLLLTLSLARTGSFLPSEQATSSEDQALFTIYLLHCIILPLPFFAGIGWHLWQTYRKGKETS